MYEIQGVSFTTEEIQSAADKYNMTFDGYLEAMQPKGIKQVEIEPKDKILSDKQKETQAARDLMSSLDIPVMEAPEKQANIEPLSETQFYTGRMSKAELDVKAEKEERQKRIDTGQEQLLASESMLNSLGNAINQLETVDDRAKYLWYFAGTFDLDTEAGKQRSEENRRKLRFY